MQIKIHSLHCPHHSCLFGLIKNRFFFPAVLCSEKLRLLFSSYCQEVAWTWRLPILKNGAISPRNSRWEFNFSFSQPYCCRSVLQCSLESTRNERPHSFPITYRRVGHLSQLLQRARCKRSTFEWITWGKNCSMWELLFDSFWLENYKVSMLFLKAFIFFKLDIGSNILFKCHCLEVCIF